MRFWRVTGLRKLMPNCEKHFFEIKFIRLKGDSQKQQRSNLRNLIYQNAATEII